MTLVDVVSGRIIKKLLHEGATVPVHCLIVENFVITTYWNSQVTFLSLCRGNLFYNVSHMLLCMYACMGYYQFKRTELSSTALYDGAIDKYELSPFAGFMSSSGGGGGGGAGGGPRKSAKSYPVRAPCLSLFVSHVMMQCYYPHVLIQTHMSSFSDGISPLTVQKTFILPRPVSALQSTITERG